MNRSTAPVGARIAGTGAASTFLLQADIAACHTDGIKNIDSTSRQRNEKGEATMVGNPLSWQIEHQCPQCGAPVRLEETDRLLVCPYCRTKLYIAARDCLRFCLPPPDGTNVKEILYIPYRRLKGLSYTLGASEITFRHVDTSLLAAGIEGPPRSLGVRPQTLALKYAYAVQGGRFLKPLIPASEFIQSIVDPDPCGIRQTYIGETVSIIYAPMYIEGQSLFDAILRRPVSPWKMEMANTNELMEDDGDRPDWQIRFVGTLCPSCGWNLEGEGDALILICRNCASAWACPEKSLERVEFVLLPSREEKPAYIPFWRVKARIEGIRLETEADLIRLANLPKVVTDVFEKTPFYFWSPAFKINPAVFLRWMRQMTGSQPPLGGGSPANIKGSLYPVNLGMSEAADTCLITLGSLIADKHKLRAILPELRIVPVESLLVYHPFINRRSELVHETLNLTVDRHALAYGNRL